MRRKSPAANEIGGALGDHEHGAIGIATRHGGHDGSVGDAQAIESLKRSVGFGIANDIAGQLVEALRNRFGVSVNQSAIRANFYRDAGES